MSFLWPWMLISLLLVPLFTAVYLRLLQKRRQMAPALGPFVLIQDSAGRKPGRKRHVPVFFFLSGLALAFFGLSRPQVFVNLPKVQGTVILAFDVSNSMAADDIKPSRMEAAKAAARTFVENQPSTILIGVVAFSNGGLVVQPPTDDREATLAAIDRLSPEGGTSLGQGIFNALNAIAGKAIPVDSASLQEGSPAPDIGRYPGTAVLLFTDGENTASPDPLEIADLAAQAGVRIYPVGIGSPEGAVLEIDGFQVLTQLDEPTLQAIASLTNGAYYRAEDAESLGEVYKKVDLRLSVSGDKMEVTSLVAGLSLLFLLTGGAFSLLWFGRMPL